MSDIRVRVGQQNTVKVISSLTGHLAGIATYSDKSGISTNVVGGIASVTRLNVSGEAIFTSGINITGIATFSDRLKYIPGNYNPPNGVGYFNNTGTLVSSASTNSLMYAMKHVFITNPSGIPGWANSLDGGTY